MLKELTPITYSVSQKAKTKMTTKDRKVGGEHIVGKKESSRSEKGIRQSNRDENCQDTLYTFRNLAKNNKKKKQQLCGM